MSSSDDPPSEVNENYPDFDYNSLQAPPEEWELYDIPDKTHLRNRALDLRTFKNLVKHHTWGFKVVIGERRTKERLLQVLKRIVFNQAPNLRPTWHEFISRKCDAGPRLLRKSYSALQISRCYPNGVPGESVLLQKLPAAQAQLGAPSGLLTQTSNQIYAQRQTGYPITHQSGQLSLTSRQMGFLPVLGRDQTQSFEPGNEPGAAFPTNYDHNLPSTSYSTMFQGPDSGYPHNLVPHAERSVPSRAQSISAASLMSMRGQMGFSIPAMNEVSAAIERTIMSFPYKPLGRHPDAQLLSRSAHQIFGTSKVDFSGNATNSGSSVSLIRVSISKDIPVFQFDGNGTESAFYGRGPVSGHDTTPLDCAIVVGRFLDAGSTIADRGNDANWLARLSNVERSFLDALNVDWDTLPNAESAKRRDEFQEVLRNWMDSRGLAIIPANVWSACTESFRQFQIHFTEQLHSCPCQRAAPTTLSQSVNHVTPDSHNDDAEGTDLAELLARFFQPTRCFSCTQCGSADSNRIERNFDQLPWRLAIRTDNRTLLKSHASRDITVNYTDTNRTRQHATYRWLGGIYCVLVGQEYHFRVYWNDHERGEIDNEMIRMYDGTQLSGTILGGLRPPETSQKLPQTWWVRGSPPLLFYERVVNPDLETLRVARIAIQDMTETVSKGHLFLKSRKDWASMNSSVSRRGQSCGGQERSDEREILPRAIPRARSFIRSPLMNLQPRPSQPPLATSAQAEQSPFPYQPAVQGQQSPYFLTLQQNLTYRQRSSQFPQTTSPINYQVQQAGNSNLLEVVADSSYPAAAVERDRAPVNLQNTTPGHRSNCDHAENLAAQHSARGSNVISAGFLTSSGYELDLPELDTITTAPYMPIPSTGLYPGSVPRGSTGLNTSAPATPQSLTGPGVSGTTFHEPERTQGTRQLTGNQRQPWASTLERYWYEDNEDAFYETHSSLRSSTAAMHHAQEAERPSNIAVATLARTHYQTQQQNTSVDNSNIPPAPGTPLDEAGTWALFDFDSASAALPNPPPTPTAFAVPVAPATETTRVPLVTTSLSDLFQSYAEHQPARTQSAAEAESCQNRPTGYIEEPTQDDAVSRSDDGGVKRKRCQEGEDNGQEVQKRSKAA